MKKRSRDAPEKRSCVWMQTSGEMFCPPGYTSLDKNEQVQKCINIIADLVSNMTIMLMVNGENGDIRVKDGLSSVLDIRPNKLMTRKQFIFAIVKGLLEKGNQVVVPHFGTNDFIEELELLPPGKVTFVEKTNRSYKIRYSATGQIFEPDEVLHFSLNPSIDFPYLGTGMAPLLRQTVETLAQAHETKKGFLRSKWQPSMIISVMSDDETLQTPEGRRRVLDSYTETTERGEPWMIPAGELDIKTVSPLTLADLKIQESIELDVKSVAAAFGIPAFMLGVGDFKTEAYNNFISTKILSIAEILQQEFTRKLLIAPDRYFKFNPRSLMQYNLGELTTHVKAMTDSGMMNKNEGRNVFDLPPSDAEGMNEYTALENNIPVAVLGLQKKLKGGETDDDE